MEHIEAGLGTFAEAADGTVTLQYVRTYLRPIGTVWSAITEPERIADWLGVAELEPHLGGRFSVRVGPGGQVPITGKVLQWEPPSVLACAWAWPGGPAGSIRYELTPVGPQATRLVFTHTGLPNDQTSSVLPGWHLYLERLGQALDGAKPEADFAARHADVREIYSRSYGTVAEACQPTA